METANRGEMAPSRDNKSGSKIRKKIKKNENLVDLLTASGGLIPCDCQLRRRRAELSAICSVSDTTRAKWQRLDFASSE